MTNPLSQYFRQPAIYVRLPSKGQFYPPGSLDMPANGELPVYPMTAIDEITYRTPDALFNGSAVITVIQSCVPNIKNAWHVPAVDVDTLLTAIRIASFGHDMEIDAFCPKCNHEDSFTLDLRSVMDKLKSADYSQGLDHGDLQVFFKPMDYQQLNSNNRAQFEEQKIIQNLAETENATEEEKLKQISLVLQKVTEMTVGALSQSIGAIKTPNALVSDPQHIAEFLTNCDRKLFNQIRDKVIELKQTSELQPIHIKCSACSNEYDQFFTLDMTSFFEPAS